MMIDTLMLVDDEDLFHMVFEDACSLLNISLSFHSVKTTDEAAKLFKHWHKHSEKRPDCVLVDLDMSGSTFDGVELIRKINFEYGNNVVIGIVSEKNDINKQDEAIKAGAQFWLIKTDNIEPRLEEFKKDYENYKKKTAPFKVYL